MKSNIDQHKDALYDAPNEAAVAHPDLYAPRFPGTKEIQRLIKSADVDSGVSGVLYEPVNLIFQTNLLNPDLLFVEAEDDTGKSVRVGLWCLDKDGFATLRITPPDTTELDAVKAGLRVSAYRLELTERAYEYDKKLASDKGSPYLSAIRAELEVAYERMEALWWESSPEMHDEACQDWFDDDDKAIRCGGARDCDCDSCHSEDDAYCWACGGKIKEGE